MNEAEMPAFELLQTLREIPFAIPWIKRLPEVIRDIVAKARIRAFPLPAVGFVEILERLSRSNDAEPLRLDLPGSSRLDLYRKRTNTVSPAMPFD